MFSAVNQVLEDHSTLFASSGVLTLTHQVFKGQLGELEGHRQVQEEAISGLTLEKEQLRIDLNQLVQRVTAALAAFATATKDANLRKKVKYSPSYLNKVSDPELFDIAVVIYNLAVPVVAELEPYFVTQAELDELQQKTAAFKLAIPQNRVAAGTRKASTTNIGALIAETSRLLREEIDTLMLPFQFMHPDFYAKYKNARIIVDYTGRRTSQEETPDPAPAMD